MILLGVVAAWSWLFVVSRWGPAKRVDILTFKAGLTSKVMRWELPIRYPQDLREADLSLPTLFALLAGLLAVLSPCLLQLTVYYTFALTGISMEGGLACFGGALFMSLMIYVGTVGSAWLGALALFLFSVGIAIPYLVAAFFSIHLKLEYRFSRSLNPAVERGPGSYCSPHTRPLPASWKYR